MKKTSSKPSSWQLEEWASRLPERTVWIFLGITLLLALVHFDPKVSIAGDDSAYIYRALLFVRKGQYPSFQGPLYPLLLAPFIALLGLKLAILKMLSVLCTLGTVWFTWRTLRLHEGQRAAWLGILLVMIFNYSVLTFASLTYSEALFMFLQAVMVWWVARLAVLSTSPEKPRPFWQWAGGGLLSVLMFLARSIGIATVASLTFWLLLRRRWREALLLALWSAAIYGSYHVTKSIIFKENEPHFKSQAEGLLLKDPYNPQAGKEDLAGFVNRFTENSVLYFSKRILQMLGFLPVTSTKKFPALAVLVWILLIGGAFIHLRRGDAVAAFVIIYTMVFSAITFVVLQTRWDQERLIMVVVPYVLFSVFSLADAAGQGFAKKWVRGSALMIFIIVAFANTGRTLSNLERHITLLRKTLAGDALYGFTPDLINFIKMSQYAAKNLPPEAKIVSRKPTISSIYAGGREFEGMYVAPPQHPDSCLAWFRKRGAEYVIDARLRQNPYKYTGHYITTITQTLYQIQSKYPEKIHLLHRIGQAEEAYLYKIDLR
ncbi:MAG: glycosyltransferase family 39 protein [Flavobacteriales bacterium]|nr:glycosyltransferase family 39 protein [Flavobacteriales bacterium]MCX7767445.1 glycosyltransferase family 39 protein [Flavobacteriales bacterium]MDW8410041.1 glycosyltransferase family 39 protein [Flavobacteriales bacterium]